jgi:hypothetical protein
MEFIKVGKNYMIKNSNGKIVSEKEMLELQNNELVIKDFKSNECQGKTTQKIVKNKKRIKEIETATSNKEKADGINKETNSTL